MSETKNYTLTVREVLQNLQALADAYEKVASGTSPTGNYYFSCNAADAAASIKAAQQLILQVPVWIPVSERLPVDIPHGYCLVTDGKEVGTANYDKTANTFDHCIDRDYWTPTHWMPLPAPPTDAK